MALGRVLVIGLDPAMIEGWDPEPIKAAIARGQVRFGDLGIEADLCLVAVDENAEGTIVDALTGKDYACVVIGGGIRKHEPLLEFFEKVVNLTHRHAPGAAIAFQQHPRGLRRRRTSLAALAQRTLKEAEVAETTVAEVMAELAALEDPRAREVNERHGDDHGVNLSKLRALAKRLKTQQELSRRLWGTGDTAARLVAILICRPKAFERAELDVMLREARVPEVHDWLVSYVVKQSPHAEELRLAWSADPDPVVASAGWALTTERVVKKPEGLDLAGLLDVIEAEMKDAPDRLQWAMNSCLAQIGIEHVEHRARAIDIGERLEVLKDYPTPPNCTSPFAPIWITELVRRQHDK